MNISLDARGPTHEPGVTRLVAAETIAQWEPGTFLENLAALPDGSWLVTIPSHNRVDLVQPDGRHEVFARLPNHVTGIVADGTAAYVLTGSMRQHDWRLVHVDESAIQTIRDLPELAFGNGMARAGDHLLAADSALSHVVSIYPRQGTSSVWLQHELLAGFTPTNPMPGANGITVHNGWVYVSNTGQALLVRCRYDVAEPASQLETVAEQLVADDFDVRSDGRIFLATHFLNSVLRLDPDGTRTTIAGHTQGIVGSTSVALDPSDPTELLVTTTGGMQGPRKAGDEPARLVRLRLNHKLSAIARTPCTQFDEEPQMSKIHIVRDYPYPVATVWRALSDPAVIPRWTSAGAGGRPEGFSTSVGTRFRFVANPKPGWNGIVNCVVLEVQQPTLLRYSWQDDAGGEITEVSYKLEPHAGGTRFTFDHTGFSGIGGFAISLLLGNVRRKMLTVGLPAVLAETTRPEEPAHEMA